MLCPKCGANVGNEIRLCEQCEAASRHERSVDKKQAADNAAETPDQEAAAPVEEQAEADGTEFAGYAGFWIRAAAFIFDNALLSIMLSVVAAMVLRRGLLEVISASYAGSPDAALRDLLVLVVVLAVGSVIVYPLYFALFDASNLQATPGKLAVGVKVLDGFGERLSILRAVSREFAKYLSAIIFCIGFVLAGFTSRKQALHDIIAGTVVMRGGSSSALRTSAVFLFALLLSGIQWSMSSSPGPRQDTVPDVTAAHPVVPPKISEDTLARVSGRIQSGETVIEPGAVYARYNRFHNRLELAFFASALPSAQQPLVTSLPTLTEVGTDKAQMLVTIGFDPEARKCEAALISSYGAHIPGMRADFQFASVEDGLVDLVCNFADGAKISGHLKQAVLRKETPFTWDLNFETRLIEKQIKPELNFGSTDANSILALWNNAADTVEVGFFGQEITAEDEGKVRALRTLTAIETKKPDVVLTLNLKKDTKNLVPGQITKYGVTFYRNEAKGLDFPGSSDKATFYYVVSGDESAPIAQLRGYLREKELISGHFQYSANKTIEDVPFRFSWDLKFDTLLVDANLEESQKQAQTAKASGPYAKASIGKVQIDLKTVLAFMYPEQNGLALGFYADPLTPAEVEQVKKKKFLWAYVNNKRPNLVVFFDFSPGQTQIKRENLLGYTMYFYRDKIGSFYFPGEYDQQAQKKLAVEIKADELETFSGNLANGQPVQLKFHGSFIPKEIGERFSWDLDTKAEIVEIR